MEISLEEKMYRFPNKTAYKWKTKFSGELMNNNLRETVTFKYILTKYHF